MRLCLLSLPIAALAILCVAVHGEFVAQVGMNPNVAFDITEASIRADFARDTYRAMELEASQVTLSSAAPAAESTADRPAFNATLVFTPSSLISRFTELVLVERNNDPLYSGLLAKYNIETVRMVDVAPANATTVAPNTTALVTTVAPTNGTIAPITTTYAPVPTQVNPNDGNHSGGDVGDDEESSTTIIIIVFCVLGGIALIACVTYGIKKWVKRDKKDTSKRTGGYKYATRNAQHI